MCGFAKFYIPVCDNIFPSLVASLFSWRCLAASTSSFLHVAMNLCLLSFVGRSKVGDYFDTYKQYLKTTRIDCMKKINIRLLITYCQKESLVTTSMLFVYLYGQKYFIIYYLLLLLASFVRRWWVGLGSVLLVFLFFSSFLQLAPRGFRNWRWKLIQPHGIGVVFN